MNNLLHIPFGHRNLGPEWKQFPVYTIDEIIKVIGVSLSEVLDWGATGYVIGFLLVVVSFFMFSSSPTLAIITGTLVFIVLSGFGLMFKDVNYGVFIILMAISFLVARIKSEGGLNG